jgi:endonuclease/exonuclease/phosphatase (EEP) superfamily protein YafD
VVNSLDLLGWIALAPMLLLCVSQWCRYDRVGWIAILQALTPFVLSLAVPLAVVAAIDGRTALAAASIVPLATLLVLSIPLVMHGTPLIDEPTAFTLGCANLLGDNPTPERVGPALADHPVDVWVLVEVTPELAASIECSIDTKGWSRADAIDPGTNGIAVWSRWPIVSGGVVEAPGRRSVDVVLAVGEQHVRVFAVHPRPPNQDAPLWSAELGRIGDDVADSRFPTVLVGDFNASRWHPSFRRLLRRGWRTAHETVGAGWSASWPTDRHGFPPPFVRLDHALLSGGLGAQRVREVKVPGSDHRGFVVDLAISRPT